MANGRPRFALSMPSSAVKALLIANSAVFLVVALIGRNVDGESLDWWLSLSWDGLFDGYGLGFARLFTYQFVHSYSDIRHIVFNMFGLYMFGAFVENEVGRSGLFRLYLSSGLVGGLIQLALGGLMEQSIHVVGASGCLYGIAVYAAFMAPRLPVLWTIQLAWLVGAMVFIGAYESILAFRESLGGSVAHGAHLGGALWGMVAFKRLRHWYAGSDHRRHPLLARFSAWRTARARREEATQRADLDRVLDKVHREGMAALTAAERRTLERASQAMKKR